MEGVPILNGISALVKMTEMAVRLKEVTGVFVSRHGPPAASPAAPPPGADLPPAALLTEQAREAYRVG